MSETKREYAANYRNPPLHTRFKKGQSGNPRGRPKKNLPALLVAALNKLVFVTIDGERRKITKREAVITQLVNESTGANSRATKMLIDMMKDIERKTEADPPPEPHRFPPVGLKGELRADAAQAQRAERQLMKEHGTNSRALINR